ncbi:hypothetical protein RhiirA4_430143 [Rhizophagus irregularis]|uniref:Uncharacterized protein n=1 Tax=Rhizophagus irregularis TaxID=588596 RepID=A0A2I1HJJ3_9GLOM|nr:hypothetical protein RhiirA4_430143 [Rhizophagus irregularis]
MEYQKIILVMKWDKDEIVLILGEILGQELEMEREKVPEYFVGLVQKIIGVFVDMQGFTKELEDSESEESPESYELESSSEEELEIIIGDKSWKFSELKGRTNFIGEDQLRYIWKIGIKLMIEMDILVMKTFIDKIQEMEEIDKEEKELRIKEWLEKETVICERCGNRRFEMDKTDNECGECIQEI